MDTLAFRPRRDGWTPDRQAAFLAALAAGGSIAAAAAAAGMSRHSAYRLRARNPAVAAAWTPPDAPPLDDDASEAIIAAAWAQRDAARAADPRGPDRSLLGELRAEARRAKRRAAAVRRRASENAGRGVSLCHLSPGDEADPCGGAPAFAARDRGARGRFVAKNMVAV